MWQTDSPVVIVAMTSLLGEVPQSAGSFFWLGSVDFCVEPLLFPFQHLPDSFNSDYEYTQSEGKHCHNYALNFYLPVHGTIVFAADDYSFRSALNATLCMWWEITGKYSPPIPLIRQRIAEFKELRPYFYGDYYPLTPVNGYLRNDTWLAYQMDRPKHHDGIILAFRRADCPDDSVRVQLSGLEKEATYELFFEDYELTIQKQGNELANGIDLFSPTKLSSLLIRYKKLN